MRSRMLLAAALAVSFTACTDAPTAAPPTSGTTVSLDSRGSQRALSTVRWNREAIALFRARGGNAGRINAYVSLAQYQAIEAALAARHGRAHPSQSGAAAGASVVVLKQFYPQDAAAIDALLAEQRATIPPSDDDEDFAAGEAIGRTVGAAVLARAAADNFGATAPPPVPVGPGYWVSSGAPTVRGGWGARPFFLRSQDELRLGPPPAFGSPAYLAALAEVKQLANNRTPEQLATVVKWVPFSGVVFNGIATDLIERHHLSELAAARVLAYANAAAFDAIIACFDTKFTYYYIRPTQADNSIILGTALPNHPSYPSGHSCETGAWAGVLARAFPGDRAMIEATETEASMSRVYGGLHYRFDGAGGLAIGRGAARLALRRRGLE